MRHRRVLANNVIPLFPELCARCEHCHRLLVQAEAGRTRRYCSPVCRKRASRTRLFAQTLEYILSTSRLNSDADEGRP